MIRPVGCRDAGHLRRGGIGIGREDDGEHRDDDVCTRVADGDGRGLTRQERDRRTFAHRPLSGYVEKPGGRIHSDHVRPAAGGNQRRVAGTAAEVDNPLTRPEGRAVDEHSRSWQQLLGRALVSP